MVRKNISHEKGGTWLFDEIRYFFYITNDWEIDAEDVVFEANDRCNQENLIAQLAGGVRPRGAGGHPVAGATGRTAVMASLAWNLKAWWALWLPEEKRWREKHEAENARILRMEFKTFNAFIKIPCQIVRGGRQLIYRVLSYNPHLPVFFRLAALRC